MRLIALDENSIQLNNLAKKLKKAKTEKDRVMIERQIKFFQDRLNNKLETENYFAKQ